MLEQKDEGFTFCTRIQFICQKWIHHNFAIRTQGTWLEWVWNTKEAKLRARARCLGQCGWCDLNITDHPCAHSLPSATPVSQPEIPRISYNFEFRPWRMVSICSHVLRGIANQWSCILYCVWRCFSQIRIVALAIYYQAIKLHQPLTSCASF